MKLKMKLVVGGLVAMGGLAVVGGPALAGVNAIPVCEDDTHNTAFGVAVVDSVEPLCSDEDQDPQEPLTYGLGANTVASGTLDFDEVTGDFTYTPNAGFVGTDDFEYFADDGFVIPGQVEAAETSELATITINVAAQITTTTTAAPTTTTTVAVAPTTTVLARTGVDNTKAAGGGFLAIGAGLLLVAASGVLVTKARRA